MALPQLIRIILGTVVLLGVQAQAASPAKVDMKRLLGADKEAGQWMSHSRTFDEQYFSPLQQIDDQNVSKLGLAWFVDLPTNQNIETTPLMVDGVLYLTLPWSKVMAVDARTGKQLWLYDPKVAGAWNINICCGVDNRGAAAWNGKIIYGTLDGRLIALDAKAGKPVWSIKSTPDERPAANSMRAAMWMPTMPKPASACGASGPFQVIPQPASRTRPWKWRPPHGRRQAGGRPAAAARCGMPSPMIRPPTS